MSPTGPISLQERILACQILYVFHSFRGRAPVLLCRDLGCDEDEHLRAEETQRVGKTDQRGHVRVFSCRGTIRRSPGTFLNMYSQGRGGTYRSLQRAYCIRLYSTQSKHGDSGTSVAGCDIVGLMVSRGGN